MLILHRERGRGRRERRGAIAVEVAIVLPLLLTLLLGVVEVGRLVEVSQILDNAAREAGRQASTGQRSTAEVREAALDYLKFAGIETRGVVVTLENLTESSRADPSKAEQLDRIAVKVTLPIDNIDWMALDRITDSTTLSRRVEWTSMRDLPVIVQSSIPPR